jgi:protoheme IX farnesyltransferase
MSQGLQRFRRLALGTAIATLALTGVGGLVRGTGSGLGCLDEWPTCRGGWIAPADYKGLIEYAHRALAGIVVVLIVVLVFAARRWARERRSLFYLSASSLAVVVAQALLGREVVTSGLHAALVTAHFLLALALVGLVTVVAATSYTMGRPAAVEKAQRRVARTSIGAIVTLLPVLVLGTYVREKGAGSAFGDWPLMGGELIPSFEEPGAGLHFAHRLLALLAAGHLIVLALRARADDRRDVRILGVGGLLLFFGQALVGAANVWTGLQPAAVVGHAALAYVTWAAYMALVVVSRYGVQTAGGSAPSIRKPFASVRAYANLTKPRIIILLLVTTVPAMVLAQRGMPPLWLIGATLLGGMMTAGSANALNQYLERDIDEKMKRTRKRPLPSHSVKPERALVFAIALGIAGFVWLTVVVNLLSAILAVSAIAFYVLVYTLLLKRSTPQNIVIGGAAGAVPVLVGWAAVTGTIEAPAWVMFAIIFLWTPPHFWALAMRYRDDYAAAGVPMLPVVRGDDATTLQIFLYAVVLVVSTLVLSPVGGLGVLYAASAAALGGGFIYRAVRLRLAPSAASAVKLFRYSITYLGLLFAAIAVDRLVW